ncbi:metallophosphoesterase family protein [Agrobacterium tumefaciens]|uniref:metallophosphoesterase family protein n=1 Tax=Agrobacterium tumefaciens TaxID=358 RepID=UPI0021D3CCE7|nr:metallophosphoesterase family protein [Agrobacterium tumefaciens]UXS24214.1 serine/threonine protein phosphatase [Agrobacterium tumefaciens]UXS52380.1 serine/threonine protein phosphatase [Agrobacterium tumefaciens]UXS62626.1 serine/threonine protein phosphatase [Agrobacterium tumefaciens]
MTYTFAIGDVHGCLRHLEKMLLAIESYAPTGTVIFLGDYIDRGPDSKGVIDRLMAGPKEGWGWTTLRGNHEEMLNLAYRDHRHIQWWRGNGGAETEISYGGSVSPEHRMWLEDLPLIYTDLHRIYVHAGLDENMPLDEQDPEVLLWKRPPPHYSGNYHGKHLVHGHTPARTNPETIGNRTNVDSGCVFWGKLSCAVFDDDKAGGPVEVIEVSA